MTAYDFLCDLHPCPFVEYNRRGVSSLRYQNVVDWDVNELDNVSDCAHYLLPKSVIEAKRIV